MAVFKFVIGDGNKSFQVEKDQKDCPVLGKKIGNVLSGDFLGLSGYGLKITGGSDKDGFPMRKDIDGSIRKKFILTKGTGFNTKISGLRVRGMLRGNTIAPDIIQINCKVVRKGPTPLEDVLGKKEEKKPEEAKEKPEEDIKKGKEERPAEKKEPEKQEKPKEDVKRGAKPEEEKVPEKEKPGPVATVKKQEKPKQEKEQLKKEEKKQERENKVKSQSDTKEEKTESDTAVKEPAQPDTKKEVRQ